MFVSAAIAAYEPPLAGMPQMVIAIRREPTSRAALVATVVESTVSIARAGRTVGERHTSDGGVTPDDDSAGWGSVTDTPAAGEDHILSEGDDPGCSDGRGREVGGVQAREDDKADDKILQP